MSVVRSTPPAQRLSVSRAAAGSEHYVSFAGRCAMADWRRSCAVVQLCTRRFGVSMDGLEGGAGRAWLGTTVGTWQELCAIWSHRILQCMLVHLSH